MTITATLSAPPDVSGQRHVILAIGSGLTGLAATKALKLAQLNITDAVVFVMGIAVHGTSHFVRQASQWTPVFPAVVTVSVLVSIGAAAAVDVLKLIAVQPDSRWKTRSDDANGFVLRHIALRRLRPIAKGWF
jgi:xanthine/uracil permease